MVLLKNKEDSICFSPHNMNKDNGSRNTKGKRSWESLKREKVGKLEPGAEKFFKDLEKMYIETPLRSQSLRTSCFH